MIRRFVILLFLALATQSMASDISELPVGVRSVLNLRQLPADSLSVYVQDLESGDAILEWHADAERNPASTMKLLTTLVALDVLGPAYQWKTEVFAAGEVRQGLLDGDLVLKGYGDPFLVTERFWQMLRDLRRRGVHDVRGDLLLDDSWFDVGHYDPGAFDNQPLRAYNVAPNALLTNFKVVRFWLSPNADGSHVDVLLDPQIDNLNVQNRLRQKRGRCRGFQRGVAIHGNDAVDEIELSGQFPSGCRRYALDRTVQSHNAYTYGLFRTLWADLGGRIEGTWHNVVMTGDADPLFTFKSLPLGDVIARVNKHSNNVMARHLLYTLGAHVNGPPGTEANGRSVVYRWLADNDLASSTVKLENGAGLSRSSRMSASDMGAILEFGWRQSYMPEFLASMSLSGLDGTLRRRFRGAPFVGKAHLKTGSLDHVTAIAGYLQSRSGRRFVLAVMQNHQDVHRGPGEEVQDALLRWLYEQ